MFTTPEHPLLERERAVADHAAYVSDVCPPLREILNRSVHEFDRCVHAVDALDASDTLHHFITLHLFRHSIVLADAVESLLSHVCVDASAPMMRSALEANAGLMYLLNGENQRGKALAWLYVTTRESIESMLRRENMGLINPVTASTLRQTYEQQLAEEPLKSIQPIYEDAQVRRSRSRPAKTRPPWYSLFDGPMNVKELIDKMLDEYRLEFDLYETYRMFSASVHGTTIIAETFAKFPNPTKVFPIRHVPSSHEDPLMYARFGVFLIAPTKRMVELYLSETQYSDYLDWGNRMFTVLD